MSQSLTDKQRELIERLGVFHEQHGLPPAEARILSLLIISDETELTFDQIRELLNISKSATSTALNMLMMSQKVVYTTRPGDRKRYFASNIVNWEENASVGFRKMLGVNKLLHEVLDQRTPATPEFNEALRNFIEFLEYMNAELPQLFEKWRNRKHNRNEL